MSFFDDKINIPQIPEITFQGVMEALTEKRKQCQALIKIMEDWRHIESTYSKKMNQLFDACNKIINEKKVGKFRDSQKEVFENLAYLMNIVSVQSKNLALKIDDDMITEAKQSIKKMSTQINNPKEVEKMRKKSLNQKRKSIQQTYLSLFERRRSIEEASVSKFFTDQCTESNLQKRMKVSKKVSDEQSEFKLMQFKLQDTITDYNTELSLWYEQSSEYSKNIKQIQSSYLKIILDLYMKAQLHRSTEYKTILHQIQRISEKQIEFLLSAESLQQKNIWQKIQIDDLDSFLIKSIKMIEDRSIEQLAAYSVFMVIFRKKKDIKEVIRMSKTFEEGLDKSKDSLEIRNRSQSETSNPAKYYQNLTKFFIDCIQGEPTEEELQKLNKLLKHDQKRRVDFISIFQKYRIEGKCRMKCSIKRTKRILQMFFNTCLKVKDAYCCRQMMVLLFTYFFVREDKSSQITITIPSEQSSKSASREISKESSRQSSKEYQDIKDIVEQPKIQVVELKRQQKSYRQSQKIYLNALVYDHSIWRRFDYWESVLIEGIYEQLLGHRKGARGSFCQELMPTAQQDIQMMKNIVFSQLLAISCNMKLLGRNQKQILVLVTKFSKMFNLGNQRIKQIEKSLGPTGEVPVICIQQMLRE